MFTWFFFIFVILFGIFALYNSFSFQIFWRKQRNKRVFLEDFISKVRGNYLSSGFFTISHQVLSQKEFKGLTIKQKKNYGLCYSVVKFKTIDAQWELFFHLIKDGVTFSEIMTVRVFPNHERIHSEANIEKIHSRLNIFTNNQYLSSILESSATKEHLDWLMRNNNDILLVLHNNLHYKIYLDNSSIGTDRGLELIKGLNFIKNKVYKKGIIGY